VAAAWEAPVADAAVKRVLLPLILFAGAFGYTEAMQVVSFRALAAPVRMSLGLAPDDLFPLIPLDKLGPLRPLVPREQVREAATIVMLAGVSWAAAGDFRTWLAALSLAFGIWDLAYYGWLRVLLGWPASILDWDILFLLPVPWAAPVLAPVISASSLVWGGAVALLHPPARVSTLAWILLGSAAVLMTVSFAWDWPYWLAGGMPRSFPWAIFGMAEALGVAGFLLARKPA
jgi:hypothetical protein